jgi:hypothetical protein
MTDTQILTLALMVLAIFAATWFNNSRFTDVNLRLNDLSSKLDTRFDDLRDVIRAEMRLESERTNNKIDAFLQQLGNHETRISRVEQR